MISHVNTNNKYQVNKENMLQRSWFIHSNFNKYIVLLNFSIPSKTAGKYFKENTKLRGGLKVDNKKETLDKAEGDCVHHWP